jgi:pimeloyl-ACP methyl ester carboxylesterase
MWVFAVLGAGVAVDENDIPDQVDQGRRRFLSSASTAALAVGAAGLGVAGAADAQAAAAKRASTPAVKPGTSAAFGPVKQVRAGVLNVGYVAAGPADGRAVVLMHGFPYDIHSYAAVTPLLAAEGYRVIVPYFRGYGTTTFVSSATPRSAEQAAFAVDILALMDALKIDKAILAGYDWGSRTGDIIAALWPARCRALVSASGYLITNLAAEKEPLPPKAEWAWWYQYYFATERGVLGLTDYRHDLGELIWKFNSPTWHFDAATYDRTAAAFNNRDYVPIVIDNYRWRLSLAKSQPQYATIEARLQHTPVIAVPAITVDGEYDPFTAPGHGAAYRDKFSGKYAHETLPVGHNVPQEAPRAFAEAVMKVDSF